MFHFVYLVTLGLEDCLFEGEPKKKGKKVYVSSREAACGLNVIRRQFNFMANMIEEFLVEPFLLEFLGGNLFNCRVANSFAFKKKNILMD